MECCRAIARWSCRRLGASLYDMASTNDAPSQDFFPVQSFTNGNVGTNPVPGVGNLHREFHGAGTVRAGNRYVRQREHTCAALDSVRRGPEYAVAFTYRATTSCPASHRRQHRVASRICRVKGHQVVPCPEHQSGYAGHCRNDSAAPAVQHLSPRSTA